MFGAFIGADEDHDAEAEPRPSWPRTEPSGAEETRGRAGRRGRGRAEPEAELVEEDARGRAGRGGARGRAGRRRRRGRCRFRPTTTGRSCRSWPASQRPRRPVPSPARWPPPMRPMPRRRVARLVRGVGRWVRWERRVRWWIQEGRVDRRGGSGRRGRADHRRRRHGRRRQERRQEGRPGRRRVPEVDHHHGGRQSTTAVDGHHGGADHHRRPGHDGHDDPGIDGDDPGSDHDHRRSAGAGRADHRPPPASPGQRAGGLPADPRRGQQLPDDPPTTSGAPRRRSSSPGARSRPGSPCRRPRAPSGPTRAPSCNVSVAPGTPGSGSRVTIKWSGGSTSCNLLVR